MDTVVKPEELSTVSVTFSGLSSASLSEDVSVKMSNSLLRSMADPL